MTELYTVCKLSEMVTSDFFCLYSKIPFYLTIIQSVVLPKSFHTSVVSCWLFYIFLFGKKFALP